MKSLKRHLLSPKPATDLILTEISKTALLAYLNFILGELAFERKTQELQLLETPSELSLLENLSWQNIHIFF